MKTIELTKGMVTQVDDDDFEYLIQWKWCYNGYAFRAAGGKKATYMHRVIMNATSEMHVDHVDRDKLNNQRSNLRLATRSVNAQNHDKKRTDRTSSYKGVSCRDGAYSACITKNGKIFHIGSYDDELAAAIAYDNAARELFGPDAKTNYPPELAFIPSKRRKRVSQYRGVTFQPKQSLRPWAAILWYAPRKCKFLGGFKTEYEAAVAWDKAAKDYPAKKLNFG
jgi:hypothetical protein